jgi:hypothetical protein
MLMKWPMADAVAEDADEDGVVVEELMPET